MQKRCLKIVVALALFCTAWPLWAQHATQLQTADSLFARKQYTQSLAQYEQLLAAGYYSPAMLLRMAMVEEGLAHPARALYYLNLNYLATRDGAVAAHMEQLAQRHQLQGYEAAPFEGLLSWLDRYRLSLSTVLAALALFCAAMLWAQVRRQHKGGWAVPALAVVLAALLTINNGVFHRTQGILTQAPVYLMSGPSAGADVVAIVNPGHRLTVRGKKDVWLQVQWADREAYVREDQLLPLQL
jgi:hypothetical protein